MLDADWTLCLAYKQHQISPTRRGQLTTQRSVHVCAFLVEGPVISACKVLPPYESRNGQDDHDQAVGLALFLPVLIFRRLHEDDVRAVRL